MGADLGLLIVVLAIMMIPQVFMIGYHVYKIIRSFVI